jgi:hypothetical protein
MIVDFDSLEFFTYSSLGALALLISFLVPILGIVYFVCFKKGISYLYEWAQNPETGMLLNSRLLFILFAILSFAAIEAFLFLKLAL